MKVLHFTNKSIFPLIDGGCVALNNFQEILLASDFEVHSLSISTEKHPFSWDEIPLDRRNKVKSEAVFVQTKFQILKALQAKLSQKSYHVERFYSKEVRQKLLQLLHENTFDCIVLESLFLSYYLPFLRTHFKGKIWCRTHNVESELWENKAIQTTHFFKKKIFSSMASDLKRLEEQILPQMDGIICISKVDEVSYQKLGVRKSCTIPLHLTIEGKKNFTPKPALFFIGSMNWFPNQEAVEWIKNSLFPAIRTQKPETILHLAGSFSQAQKDSNRGCFQHGKVPDVNQFMREHGILFAPFKSASGVRVKILEAMRIGVPVVSNKKGFQGISIRSGVDGICVETDEELINACLELLQNEEKRIQIGRAAQDFIAKNYNLNELSIQLRAFIESK